MSAPGATVLIQTTSSPDMPHDAHVPQWACPPFVAVEEGGASDGQWVLVTQITPHHTAYLHLTPNSMANRVSPEQQKL